MRLLKPLGLALGLFAITTVAGSCAHDGAAPTSPVALNPALAADAAPVVDLVFYDFTAGVNASTVAAGLSAGPMTRGPGLTFTSASGAFNSSSWTAASSPDVNDFVEFLVTPDADKQVTLSSLDFSHQRSSTGPGSWIARAILGDGSSVDIGSGTTATSMAPHSLSIPASAQGPHAAPIRVRFYAYGATGQTGTWRVDNVRLRGAVTSIGEPPPTPVVDHITVEPASASVFVGNNATFTATAKTSTGVVIPGVSFEWSSSPSTVATISPAGVATGKAEGDATITATAPNGVFGTATLHVDPVMPPPTVRFSEIHYDNSGTDANEAIEVEGPAGTDLTGWSIVLYNGSNDPSSANRLSVYDTRVLSGAIAARAACSNRGVLVFSYPSNGIQNGGADTDVPTVPDGFALVDGSNQVVEFLSYEGTFTAANGPAAGMTSKNIGVSEPSNASASQSLQRAADGTAWSGPSASSFGRCTIEGPTPPPNGISFSGRSLTNGDPPLPVGYEDQLFATLRDGVTNQVIVTTWTWTAETPELASIDANGVMRGLAAGTAIFRATAADGSTATYSFPIEVLQESNAAYQNHAEFGEPRDADDSDDYILRRREFTSSYNKNRGSPNWVAYNLEQSHFGVGPSDRCDCFTHDPLLPASFPKLTTADYTGAGGFLGLSSPETLDRGHMARSSDRMTHTLDNANTYLLSNIVPQFGDLNQGPWNNFEQYLHDLAGTGTKELFIITGPAGNAGTLKNEGKIVMPTHTWKVAVIMDRNEGLADVRFAADIEVLAVIMPNIDPRTADIRNVDWHTYLTTVDAVEALSGYDVLALLDDQIEIAIESNTKPPVAVANGPFTGNEGGSISMSGAGSTDPDGDALTYAWDFGDVATASGATTSHTYAQNGNYTVTLTVTDIRGLTSVITTTATVANVAPAFALTGATILPGETYSTTGSFTDPGADTWNATVNYGDGSGAQALALSEKAFSLSHTYANAGTFTVTVTVNDGTATTNRTATVVVDSWSAGINKLGLMVAGLGLPRGNANSLQAKLDAALRQIEADRNNAPAHVLDAFMNELEAMVNSGRITSAAAAPLNAYAQRIVASITN